MMAFSSRKRYLHLPTLFLAFLLSLSNNQTKKKKILNIALSISQYANHFCVKMKKRKIIQTINKPVKVVDKELPTTTAEQAVSSLERKAVKSAEQAMQHVEEPRNGRPLQLKNQHRQLKSNNRGPQPKNQNPSVDPKLASKKIQNTAPAATESRASAAPKAINPIKNQASKPASKKILRPLVPNWFQMLQPPPKKQS